MSKSARGSITAMGSNVSQKRGLNRSLQRVSFYKIKQILVRAFEKRGKDHHEVNPGGTSQTCSICGHRDRNSRESQSEFRCTSCGHTANADENAARNVRARGWGLRNSKYPPWVTSEGGNCPRSWGEYCRRTRPSSQHRTRCNLGRADSGTSGRTSNRRTSRGRDQYIQGSL